MNPREVLLVQRKFDSANAIAGLRVGVDAILPSLPPYSGETCYTITSIDEDGAWGIPTKHADNPAELLKYQREVS